MTEEQKEYNDSNSVGIGHYNQNGAIDELEREEIKAAVKESPKRQ